LALAGLLLGVSTPSAAEALPKPLGGEIILAIDGAIANGNGNGGAFFDLALLKTLPSRELVTETPWTKGKHSFTGVPLEALMQWIGAEGKTITAFALNDYSVDLPIDDGAQHGALVVYLFDGQPMLPSDRGPLWIVYPFSADPSLKKDIYFSRCVWQLSRLTVQ